MTIRAIIIDDEQPVIQSLQKLLATFCGDIRVVGTAQSAKEGIKLIEDLNPELVFLDVVMPRFDGFHVLEHFRPEYTFQCVFTTAHEEYAIKAIKHNALDYLLKPVDPDELIELVNKIKKSNKSPDYNVRLGNLLNTSENKRIGLPNGHGIDWVKVGEIMYIHADGNYCHVWLRNGTKMLITKRLKEFEEQLKEDRFIRAHKSYLVNLLQVKGYIRSYGGQLVMENGAEIPVSEKYKYPILQLMGLG